jgi:prepilin-type N-terminal cleavage/methylation domain-containing protein
MDQSAFNRKQKNANGFTLMETMFAIVILSIGLLSLAALLSKMTSTTERSRYMSVAAMLASEKLEDLNRYPAGDPAMTVTGASAGSLAADTTGTVGGETVAYFDRVVMSSGNGTLSQTIRAEDSSGTVYKTLTHTPNGQVTPTQSATPPANTVDMMIFNRRWLIEKDTPITGVRRVTVRVSLTSPVGPAVDFQMSAVRP